MALIALPLSGWIWSSVAGKPIMVLGLVPLPLLTAAALKYHFVDKDGVLKSMLPNWMPRR